jgi:CRISPR-associated endonuclease/helicase Cas3
MINSQSNPTTQVERGDSLLLPGLDGANPLGFLAATGLFKVLVEQAELSNLRIAWTPLGGTWVPFLWTTNGLSIDEARLLDILAKQLTMSISDHPVSILEEQSKVTADGRCRRELFQRVADGTDRTQMAWIAAFGSDIAPPESINQLQTTRRDYFYGNMEAVISRTRQEHLRRAIFQPWDYADALDNQSLHLDPSEDRRHAYQWNKPAGDPDRKFRGGMLGANRLALEAISIFPSFPEAGTLRTVGFTGNRSTNTRWTWPIWSVGLSLPVLRSVISQELLQKEIFEADDIAKLKAQGIVAAYRTRRILVGKTPNFTPAQRIA